MIDGNYKITGEIFKNCLLGGLGMSVHTFYVHKPGHWPLKIL